MNDKMQVDDKMQLEVKHLFYSYGEKSILEDLVLKIDRGSFISIIGRNGSGKTTLLKTISTLLKPYKGTVLLEGRDLFSFDARKIASRIAVVPQDTAAGYEFKVYDMVMMGRYPYLRKFRRETPEDAAVVEKVMEETGITHLRDRFFNELSGGEKQRVIIARAFAQQPGILLLDEPISHLDIQYQIEMLRLVRKMSRDNGLTVITVLHDLNLASIFSDYILLLHDRRLKAFGTPAQVVTEENIKEAFNVDIQVSINPVNNRPVVSPILKPSGADASKRIHIICGGGSGGSLIRTLHALGHTLTAGVLNIGDSDWRTCREYSIETAAETPFAAISDQAYRRNLHLAGTAETIILTDTYFGPANLRNLEILLDENLASKELMMLLDKSFAERDFTEGKAQGLYARIISERKPLLCTLDQAIEKLGGSNV